MKYYELIEDGYDKVGGTLYAPSEWPCPIAVDAMEVENWQNLTLELRDGKYCPFLSCDAGANMVSEEMKDLLLSFIGDNDNIEFLPVTTKSKEYGDTGQCTHIDQRLAPFPGEKGTGRPQEHRS